MFKLYYYTELLMTNRGDHKKAYFSDFDAFGIKMCRIYK